MPNSQQLIANKIPAADDGRAGDDDGPATCTTGDAKASSRLMSPEATRSRMMSMLAHMTLYSEKAAILGEARYIGTRPDCRSLTSIMLGAMMNT